MWSERLEHIAPAIQQRVDEVTLPGASVFIARKGSVAYFEQFGYADVEAKRPMQPDTIVRLDSQPKPITGVAVMMLFEEGKFQLDDPDSKYLPEFKNVSVLVAPAKGKTTAANGPMTVKHLLTRTSGLTCWSTPSVTQPHQHVRTSMRLRREFVSSGGTDTKRGPRFGHCHSSHTRT